MQIDTKVSLEGVKFDGDDFDPSDLERSINVPARNEQIVKLFKSEEEKRDSTGLTAGEPKKHRKAIVFAVTKRHAAQLAYYFNQEYPEYKGRYAEVITSDTEDPEGAIRRFKLEEMPMIAVSVGMMDTGVDAPKVENLIMVRPTRSPILYQQMRGRGSRLELKSGKTSFRIYDFAGVTKLFNDVSYNPYVNSGKTMANVPWGTEPIDVEEGVVDPKSFIQVPEAAKENIDLIIRRAHVEIGPEGEKIDADDYQMAWERQVQELAKTEPIIAKVKEGHELTSDETASLSEKLNSPKFYFNEANLREAYRYPIGAISEFIKAALKLQELPTEEQLYANRVDELFESWLIDKNFSPEQVKVLRLVKNQFVAQQQPIDASIFNQPVFQQIGGLNYVLKLFSDNALKETLAELNQTVFVK